MNKVCIITGFDSKTDRCAVGQYADRLKASLSVTPNSSVEKLNLRSRSLFRWLGALKRAFSQNQVVHLQYPLEAWGTSVWPGLLPGLFRLFYRKTRLVVTFHEWGSTHPLRKLSMVPTAFFADCIVSVSRHVQKEVLDDKLIQARPRKLKSAFIPVGSNIQVLQPETEVSQAIRSLYRQSSDTRLIGYFGFLYGWKQPYKLLELARAMKERGEDVRFLIIGDFPVDHVQQKQAYLDYIREHKLDDVVEMVGFVPSEFELSNWLGACDGVVQLFADGLTVRRSSFWTVLNLGVPLITTRPASTEEFTGLVSLEQLQTDGQLYLVEPSIDLDEVMEQILDLRPYQLPCARQQSPDWETSASQHRDLYACVSKAESASSLQNSECAIGRET